MTAPAGVRAEHLTLADVVSDRLQRLHRLWALRRGKRRWPAYAEFAGEDFAFIAGTISLVDVLRAPVRFRMRRIGASIEELRGPGDQGKMVEEIEPKPYAELPRRHYAAAVEGGEPLFHLVQFLPGVRPARFPLAYERAILPLSGDGDAVDMLLIGSDWSEAITSDLRKFHEGG